MSLSVELAYGKEMLPFSFADLPALLKVSDPPMTITPDLFKRRLSRFMDQTALDLSCPALVVADKTRLCGYPQYLSALTAVLDEKGAALDRLKIHIAYGTHPRQSEAESRAAYGDLYGHLHWIHHQCDDPGAFETLGETRRGTPVRLRKDILAASCVITFGAVSHHYFAGYGGGRKLIFPGLGEKEAIYANHGLFLDRAGRRLASECKPGALKGNPLAEDLAEVASFRTADLAIHGILDSDGQVCDLMVGQGMAHFEEACARYGAHCEIDAQRYDLVLASCGGFPKDINFIQSHKAIHNAAALVRDGGQLIVLAQCPDGIGSQTFLPWFEMKDWHAAFGRLAARYVGNGGTALAMMAKLQRIDIALVTDLQPALADTIGFRCFSADQAQRLINQHTGSKAVIPNASVLVASPGAGA